MALDDQTFSDVIRGMQHAVNTAQAMLDEHQLWRFQSFFVDGKPRTVSITMPDGEEREIPQISLMPLHLLSIEEIQLEFTLSVNTSMVKEIAAEQLELKRSSISVEFGRERGGQGGDRSDISVRILFKQRDEPEGFARVKEGFDKEI